MSDMTPSALILRNMRRMHAYHSRHVVPTELDGRCDWSVIVGMQKVTRELFGTNVTHYTVVYRSCACSVFLDLLQTAPGLFGDFKQAPTLYRVFIELAECQFCDVFISRSNMTNMRDFSYCAAWNCGGDGSKMGDGVIVWGNAYHGGSPEELDSMPACCLGPLVSVVASGAGFCALDVDGNVMSWGDVVTRLGGVVSIFASSYAYAALMENGHVVAWGESSCGGRMLPLQRKMIFTNIIAGRRTFTGITESGELESWGETSSWRHSQPLNEEWGGRVIEVLSSGGDAYLGRSEHGRVMSWGAGVESGDAGHFIEAGTGAEMALRSGARAIATIYKGFAAIDAEGHLWCSIPETPLSRSPAAVFTAIIGHIDAFAASNVDGRVMSWGPGAGPMAEAEEHLEMHVAHSAVCLECNRHH